MTDPAIDRVRSFLLKGGLKDTVILREDLAGIVQAVRGPSAEPQRIEALQELYDAVHLYMYTHEQWGHEQSGYTAQTDQEAWNRMKAAWFAVSEPMATVLQEEWPTGKIVRPLIGEGPSLGAAKGGLTQQELENLNRVHAEAMEGLSLEIIDLRTRNARQREMLETGPAPDPQRGSALENLLAQGRLWTAAVDRSNSHPGTPEGLRAALADPATDFRLEPLYEAVLAVGRTSAALSAAKAPTDNSIGANAHLNMALAEARAAITTLADYSAHKNAACVFRDCSCGLETCIASPAVRAALGEQG